jgi:hypothetical protein
LFKLIFDNKPWLKSYRNIFLNYLNNFFQSQFATETSHRIPLAAPLAQPLRNVSNNMICFTPESVLHPFHMTELRVEGLATPLPSPIHAVAHAAIKYY